MNEMFSALMKQKLMNTMEPVQVRPGYEVVTLVVTVKAYPAVGRATGESVCVAGVRIDTPLPEWIRLFPVPFRELQRAKQFSKWQIIRLRVKRGTTDRRHESYRPDLSTLRLGATLSTNAGNWADRWEVVEPLVDQYTACEFYRSALVKGQNAPSLGLITPREIKSLSVEVNDAYINQTEPGHEQLSLFGEPSSPLDPPPFKAAYRYLCRDAGCKGHEQTLIDWESGVFARRQIQEVGIEKAKEQHHQKFYSEICSPRNDTKFFIGNQHSRPNGFLVLGVFYPKKGTQPMATLDF